MEAIVSCGASSQSDGCRFQDIYVDAVFWWLDTYNFTSIANNAKPTAPANEKTSYISYEFLCFFQPNSEQNRLLSFSKQSYLFKYSEDVVGAIRASSWSLGNWPNLRRSFRFQGFFVAALKAALRSAPASLRWDPALVTFILNHRQQTGHGHTQMTTCQGTWLPNGNSETQLKQASS